MLLRWIEEDKKWIVINEKEKQEGDLYLPKKLIKCLNYYKQQQKNDNDIVLILSGNEGSGKSTLMGNVLEYISDTKFSPTKDLIGSDYLDGLHKIEDAPQGGYLGFDEGNSFFLATETTTTEHRDLHKVFSIFRQKNLFVVICLPGFFRLGTYFALDRSVCLMKTYLRKGKRGFFAFYGRSKKDALYRLGKPTYNDNLIEPNFRATFSKCHKLENQEYKTFKKVTLRSEIQKARDKYNKKVGKPKLESSTNREVVARNIDKPVKEVAKLLGISERAVYFIKSGLKEDANKITA